MENNNDNRAIVDSRRAGEGKTRDQSKTARFQHHINLSIYGRIKHLVDIQGAKSWHNRKVVVALPSKLIIQQYLDDLTDYYHREMNLPKRLLRIEAIDSDHRTSDSVQYDLHQALNDQVDIILITHQTFMDLQSMVSQRQQYDLIVDEAITPFREITLYQSSQSNIDFRWRENGGISFDTDAVTWPRIDFKGLKEHSFDDSETLRNLMNSNWINRVDYLTWNKFTQEDGNKKITIIQELRPDVFWHWRSVWIACADFENTFMADWMLHHNQPYKIHPRLEFEAHETPLRVYGANNVNLSRNLRDKNPNLLAEYQQAVQQSLNNEPLLVLRNNNQPQLFKNEIKLPHNSAGLNDYRHYKNISLESSLNADPIFADFLKEIYPEQYGDDPHGRIFKRRTLYTYYQTLMRSCIREGLEANIFCLDSRTINGLNQYFDCVRWEEWDDFAIQQAKPAHRPLKTNLGRAMTGAERKWLSKNRSKPDFVGMTDDELLEIYNNRKKTSE